MNINLRLADTADKLQLINIWKKCFNDTDVAINYFFENKFSPNNCMVCEVGSVIVSSLYIMDINVVTKNGLALGYYLYAAGTLPQYRGNGYMKNLIEYSNHVESERKKEYSVLLPANYELYNYYKKLKYQNMFYINEIELSQSEIKKYINKSKVKTNKINFDDIYNLRLNICNKSLGNVIWDKNSIKYAFGLNQVYGGKNIVIDDGYAICNKSKTNVLISEFMVTKNSFKNLMTAIYNEYPDCNYTLRSSNMCNCFSKVDNIKCFGMIKNINNFNDRFNFNDFYMPYIGLTLD